MAIRPKSPRYSRAIPHFIGDASLSYTHNDEQTEILEWDMTNTGVAQPTEAEIDAKIAELDAADALIEYKEDRKDDYPEWGEQLEKIYDDGIDKWKAEMVDPVKAKWPKDNSGPI